MLYLVEWGHLLHGRSGIGFGGVAPLSFTTVRDWAVLMDIGELDPFEVEALLQIDAALLDSSTEPEKDEVVTLQEQARPKWPERKDTR